MDEPARLHTSEPRDALKLGVALIPSTGTVHVQPLAGTTGHRLRPSQKFTTQKGTRASSLSSGEYESFIRNVLGRLKRGVQHFIIHDREPAHRGIRVRQLIERAVHTAILLPPRSPDMDPLDYAVFDQAKNWLAKERPSHATSWEKRVRGLLAYVNRLDPVRLVAGYGARLAKVLTRKGGRIE